MCWLCWWPRWWKMVDFYCSALVVSGKPITNFWTLHIPPFKFDENHFGHMSIRYSFRNCAECLYPWLCYGPAIRAFSLLCQPKPVICAFTPFASIQFGKQVYLTFLYVSTFLKGFESFCWGKNPLQVRNIEICSVLWNSILPYWKLGLTCQQIPQLGHISLNQKVGTAPSI